MLIFSVRRGLGREGLWLLLVNLNEIEAHNWKLVMLRKGSG